jgi:hypothetical protein
MLLIVLNVVNFGYFFLVAVNLAASPRSGVEYSILGNSTPGTLSLPPYQGSKSVSFLSQQDLVGALNAPTGANILVCSETAGLTGTGANQTTKCMTCTGTGGTGGSPTCSTGTAVNPAIQPDPESPSFILNRVDVTYTFNPIIPGTPFGLAILAIPSCTSTAGNVTCVFHRQVSMRVMN